MSTPNDPWNDPDLSPANEPGLRYRYDDEPDCEPEDEYDEDEYVGDSGYWPCVGNGNFEDRMAGIPIGEM